MDCLVDATFRRRTYSGSEPSGDLQRRHDDYWSLPGAIRFIDENVIKILQQKNLFIALQEPFDARGLCRVIFQKLETIRSFLPQDIKIGPNCSLLRNLCAHFSIEADDFDLFVNRLESENIVFLLQATKGANLEQVHQFAKAATRPGIDTRRLRIVLVFAEYSLNAETFSDNLWLRRQCTGLLTRLDICAFLARQDLNKDGDGVLTRLKGAVAMEVGAWDLSLVAKIYQLGYEAAARPDLHVQRWSNLKDEHRRKLLSPTWENGSSDDWDGVPTPHAAWLAYHDPMCLEERVWRGQLSILFPWLEERRRMVIRRNYKSLMTLTDETIETLDWGELDKQLSHIKAADSTIVRAMRIIRNALAHGQPIQWVDLQKVLNATSGWEICLRKQAI